MRLPMNTSLAMLKPSGIRRINALAAQHPGCIALALGEPDFPTPDVISAEVTAALDRGDTHYPPNNGRPALREALSAYMGDAGLTFSADEVILTDGATEALSATFMAMLNPGDEVIIPTPAFGLYESIVVANHAKAVFLDTEPAQFQIDEDALRACVTPATKAIVICSPYGLHPQRGIARRRGARGGAGGHLRGLRRRIQPLGLRGWLRALRPATPGAA